MAISRSSASVISPEHNNWVSFAHGLVNVICDGLRPFVTIETLSFYNNVSAAVAAWPGAGPCTCTFNPSRRPNKHHDMRTCAWAIILQGHHHRHTPNWKQSDATKWTDPVLGPWEIAKLFLPDLGGHVVRSAEDLDVAGILNLMYWCDHFRPIPQTLIKDLRDIRNRKWGHVTKLELSSVEKATAFCLMEALLQDPKLTHDLNAQNALREIQILKTVTDVNNFQAQILLQYKETIEKDISDLKTESKRNLKIRKQLEKRLRFVEKELASKTLRSRDDSPAILVKNGVLFLCNNIIKCTRVMSRQRLKSWLMIILLCSFSVTLLDPRSFEDGCPKENTRVPFESKEFNMSEYLEAARVEDFVGRQWLYREVEDAFKDTHISGVQIVGSPGSGKSALSSQLVCSRTSSSWIHNQILGYHYCKYSDKNTQMAGKFVRNLAEMIARRLPEYGYLISKNSYIQRSLKEDCIHYQDPVGCFELAVLSPLRNLNNKPNESWFIVVDALDECITQSETIHSIVYLLNNKIHRFPSWLKLIVTLRNESDASLHSSRVINIIIDPEDPRNHKDLEVFIAKRVYQDSPLLQSIKRWFGDDSVESTTKLATTVLTLSQGNFLFVKELLNHWEHSRHELRSPYSLPKTLEDLYHNYFERLYLSKDSFNYARKILELLVSTFEPLKRNEIFQLLRMRENNLDEEYDFNNRLKKLGHFLRYGKDNTVTLYHLSLAEWLTSKENQKFFVNKRKGHEAFCDYYFRMIHRGGESVPSKYILILAQHIVFGASKDTYVQEFLGLPSQSVNVSDPLTSATLLHHAATIENSGALELLSRHFSCIDCVDNRGITPAFLAAEHGLVDNLELLVGKGANINRKTKTIAKVLEALQQTHHTVKGFYSYVSDASHLIDHLKSKFFDASMLHAAAKGGHIRVIRFLIKNNARLSMLNGEHLTAIQIAAENGHLEVIKTLYKAGAVADQTALHHAAANNRLDVVKFLLDIGVKDECLRCDGSFFWLKAKHGSQSSPIDSPCSDIPILTYNVSKVCIDLDEKWPVDAREMYDDKHLILCHSALHAAVSSGHEKVVSRLLSEENNALNCYDYSGRTPLHEAVRTNNTKIVNILVEKQPQMVQYKCRHWQKVSETVLTPREQVEYLEDVCHCGYTPLHLAARYGHKQLATTLIMKRSPVDDRDCSGATPIHVAACHNQTDLISLLIHPNIGVDINAKTLNGSTPLHSAAVCGAVEVIDYMLDMKANLTAVDDYGLTALHYSIINNTASQWGLRNVYRDKMIKSGVRWLDTFVKLLFKGSNIDAADNYGRTPLHIAARNGLARAVNVLLQMNASFEMKDKNGNTPLEVAFENAPVISQHIRFTSLSMDKIDDLRPRLHGHRRVIFLLLYYGASNGKCDSSRGSMLHMAIMKKQHNIAHMLMRNGASLECKDSLGRTPLVTYLNSGERFTDVLLRDFTKSVAIECRKPFNYSVFHLLSYLRPTFQNNNFFYLTRNCSDPLCKVNRAPLAEAIESHPEKEKIISFCFDAEGFTPLHRAAQGANLVAIRYLLANGANDSVLSPNGYNALTLAVLYAGKRRLWEQDGRIWVEEDFRFVKDASQVAIELLHFAMKNRGYKIRCDSSKPDLTLYHIAASRGLVEFIEALFSERDLHQLDVDCTNVDGITPMYLAKLYKQRVKEGVKNPWEQVIQLIKRYGGKMQYPKHNAVYSMIYNGVYGWIPNEFTLDLRSDTLQFIMSLLKSYEKSEGKSFQCLFDPYRDLSRESHQYYWPVMWLRREINESVVRPLMRLSGDTRQCSREEEFLRRDMRRSFLYMEQFRRYLSKLSLYRQGYTKYIAKNRNWEVLSKIQQNWFQKEVINLMMMRHTEVFGIFASLKSLSYRFKRVYHLLDGRDVTSSLTKYEKNPPVDGYLSSICDSMQFIFEEYLSYRERNQLPNEFRLRDKELFSRSEFFNGQIKMYRNVPSFGSNSIEWPLEFFLKRSFGFFSRYDYLKTLHIGIEPRTYVQLHPNEIRCLVGHDKIWYRDDHSITWFDGYRWSGRGHR